MYKKRWREHENLPLNLRWIKTNSFLIIFIQKLYVDEHTATCQFVTSRTRMTVPSTSYVSVQQLVLTSPGKWDVLLDHTGELEEHTHASESKTLLNKDMYVQMVIIVFSHFVFLINVAVWKVQLSWKKGFLIKPLNSLIGMRKLMKSFQDKYFASYANHRFVFHHLYDISTKFFSCNENVNRGSF